MEYPEHDADPKTTELLATGVEVASVISNRDNDIDELEAKWMNLLHTRPSPEAAGLLAAGVAVSVIGNKDKDIDELEEKWMNLFHTRPSPDDPDYEVQVTLWLIEAIFVSNYGSKAQDMKENLSPQNQNIKRS